MKAQMIKWAKRPVPGSVLGQEVKKSESVSQEVNELTIHLDLILT